MKRLRIQQQIHVLFLNELKKACRLARKRAELVSARFWKARKSSRARFSLFSSLGLLELGFEQARLGLKSFSSLNLALKKSSKSLRARKTSFFELKHFRAKLFRAYFVELVFKLLTSLNFSFEKSSKKLESSKTSFFLAFFFSFPQARQSGLTQFLRG